MQKVEKCWKFWRTYIADRRKEQNIDNYMCDVAKGWGVSYTYMCTIRTKYLIFYVYYKNKILYVYYIKEQNIDNYVWRL
jgi:hypothetical protein